MSDDDSVISLSREQKSAIADGIIWGTLTMMKLTIGRESPDKCAAHDSKRFGQSKMAIADNTISIHILTNDQKLPARPRDFRLVLANEERNIGNPELSDVLASICRRLILEHSEKNFANPRGRPISQSNSNNETRGRKSYYDISNVKEIIDQVLNDREFFKKIDDAITSSDIYFKHRKYSIEVSLYQMKQYGKEFINTYRPVFNKYGIEEISSSNAYANREEMTDDWIEKTAAQLAIDIKPIKEQKRAMYTQGGIIYFDRIMQKHRTIT